MDVWFENMKAVNRSQNPVAETESVVLMYDGIRAAKALADELACDQPVRIGISSLHR
jgi:hypothetical protein